MPLQKQTLSLPIVGGLNEKEDALLSLHPQVMTNCLYRKTGAVSKRFGYACIGPYNLRSDATVPAQGELLATFNDELLRIGGGTVDSFQVVNGASDWLARGRVPEVAVIKEPIVTAGVTSGTHSDPQVAFANGYLITSYIAYDGATYRVLVDVFNAATGARAYAQHQLAQSTTALSNARCDAIGTTAGVFWVDSANYPPTAEIRGSFLDLTTMTWGTVATAFTDINSSYFDVQAKTAGEWIFAFVVATGPDYVFVKSIGTDFAVLAGGAIAGTTKPLVNCVSLRYVPGERVWVAATFSTAAPLTTVEVFTTTPALVQETPPLVVFTSSTTVTAMTCAIERLTATRALVAWDRTNGQTSWNEVEFFPEHEEVLPELHTVPAALGVVQNESHLERAQLLSRPFVRDGRAYALVANVHGTHATQFLIDLHAQEPPSAGVPARVVATILPRQLPAISISLGVTTAPRSNSTSNVVLTSANEYVVASSVAGLESRSFNIVGLALSFAARRTAAQTSSLLILGGGAASAYDGTHAFELGFAYEPDVAYLAAFTTSAGGGLLASTTYNYKFVYAWQDAQGNVYRSAPSLPVVVTTGAGHGTVSGTVPPLHLANRVAASNLAHNIRIEIYRTGTTGGIPTSNYKLVASISNFVGLAPIAFTDTMSDVTLATKAALYTTGGVLEHVTPASASLVCVWKNAVLLAGTDDDAIWVSGEIVAGEGPWFSDSTTIDPFEGGRVTALSSLDATLVLFKSDGIWIVEGEPPNDLGVSTLTAPRRVQTDVGCTDAASVVLTGDGILFKGRTGLYLLNRSLQVIPMGKGVEDSYRAEGFAGAVTLPAQGLVRWLQRGTTGFDVLNLDTYHSAIYGGPVWSKDVLADVREAEPANPVGGVMWRGRFVWLSAAGYLYEESEAGFADTDGFGAASYVTMTFETSFQKGAGPSGYQRVWRAHVLANRVSAHDMAVTITTDLGTEGRVWTAAEIAAFPGLPAEKLMCHVAAQKCQWMKVKVADYPPALGDLGNYAGMTLRDITLVLGIKPGGARVSAANRK